MEQMKDQIQKQFDQYLDQMLSTTEQWNYSTHVENLQNIGKSSILLCEFLQNYNNQIARIMSAVVIRIEELSAENELLRNKVAHLENCVEEYEYD